MRHSIPLIGLLLCLYLFTYSGQIESGDTRRYFDVVSSVVRFGDTLLDETAWVDPPDPRLPNAYYPLTQSDTEPLLIVLAAPLYALAYVIPGLGLVHTVWLFNILVSIGLCLALLGYARTLGYATGAGLAAALALGLLTIIWPYTRTFFREPLAGLMILLTFWAFERWRRAGYRSIFRLLTGLALLIGAFLAKEAVALALPALLILLLPERFWQHPRLRRWIQGATLLLMLAWVSYTLMVILLPAPVYNGMNQVAASLTGLPVSQISTIHSAFYYYLFSPGGSVWGTSPILLLALPGCWLLYRRGDMRHLLLLLILPLSFALGYAALRGQHWFGGLSWPPRFLLPMVPLLLLATLPVWETMSKWVSGWAQPIPSRTRAIRIGSFLALALLIVYSLWVQLSAVSYPLGAYNALLPPEANGLGEWPPGLLDVRYFRWTLIPQLWGREPPDFAWVRVGIPAWGAVCAAGVIIALWGLWRGWRGWQPGRWVGLALPLMIGLVGVGLRSINGDIIYSGANQAMRDMLPLIDSQTRPGDVVLLTSDEYEPFFLNHGRLRYARIITLPDQLGERSNDQQPMPADLDNPEALMTQFSVALVHNLAQTRERLWLLADNGPWIPWSIRPVERLLTTQYYPLGEVSTDTRARLIHYRLIDAPDPSAFRGPDAATDLIFDENIRLVGYSLPGGTIKQAGETLALSLVWQVDAAPERNATLAWFVANADGQVVAQGVDTQPQWGFRPFTTFIPGAPVWDHHALDLPPDLPPGEYAIWLRLYASDAPDQLLPVTGSQTRDGTIGILPLRLVIQSRSDGL